MAMPEAIVQRWNEMTKEAQEQAIDFSAKRERRPQKTHLNQWGKMIVIPSCVIC